MKSAPDRARRTALVLLACAVLAPQRVLAQDPRAATVQRVARDWLGIVDRLDAGASWKAAGERFRSAIPLATWTETIKRDREPRGALVQRTVAATGFDNAAVGLPEGGSYAVVQFRSAFANNAASVEEIMLEVGPDYAWHVIGYLIH